MKACQKTILLSSMLFVIGMFTIVVSPVMAREFLVWIAEVPNSGAVVTSSVLELGRQYRIVAEEIWWYNYSYNLAADAQYYTTDGSNNWNWGDHFPAPGGHSFLQINGQDVNWGPFSNGDKGHTYTIYYVGEGVAITFRIVDWMDQNYGNNDCHLLVRIYREVPVGGYVVDSNVSEIFTSPMIVALMLAVGAMFPVARHYRKTRR